MTFSRFRRLFLVLLLPLLLGGYLWTIFVDPYRTYAYILCAPSPTGDENCRQVGDPDNPLHVSVKAEYPHWFDVEVGGYDDRAPLFNFVQASTRLVPGIEIVDALPFAGNPVAQAATMAALKGKSGVVQLGAPKDGKSVVLDDNVLLFCNNLRPGDAPGQYISNCAGEDWSGPVAYRTTGVARQELDRLIAAITTEFDERQFDYNLYRAVSYPIFVVGFLLIALLCWLFVRARRYVMND